MTPITVKQNANNKEKSQALLRSAEFKIYLFIPYLSVEVVNIQLFSLVFDFIL